MTNLTLLGKDRFSHDRSAARLGAACYDDVAAALHDFRLSRAALTSSSPRGANGSNGSSNGGGPRHLAIGVTRYNLFKLPAIADHARELLGMTPREDPFPALSARPPGQLRARAQSHMSALSEALQDLPLPVDVSIADDQLEDLLDHVDTRAGSVEDRVLLRAMGPVFETALAGPQRILISLSNACNLDCVYCRSHSPLTKNEAPREYLHFRQIQQAIDEAAEMQVERISLAGSGDPTIHPRFPEVVRLIKAAGLAVDISTNGILLPPATREALVESGADSLTVSVSGVDPESYEKLHPSSARKVLPVLSNVRALAALKEQRGAPYPHLIMLQVITNQNVDDIPRMVELAAETGFNGLWLQILHVDPFSKHLVLTEDQARRLPALVDAARDRCRELGLKYHDYIDYEVEQLEQSDGFWSRGMERSGCFVGYYFSYMMVDHHVSFCCGVKPVDRLSDDRTFGDVWSSDTYDVYRYHGKFLGEAHNIDLPDRELDYRKRFFFNEFCLCCDNHNFNAAMIDEMRRTGLDAYLRDDPLPPPTELLEGARIAGEHGEERSCFLPGDTLSMKVTVRTRPAARDIRVRFYVTSGEFPFRILTSPAWNAPRPEESIHEVTLSLERVELPHGTYGVEAAVGTLEGGVFKLFGRRQVGSFSVKGPVWSDWVFPMREVQMLSRPRETSRGPGLRGFEWTLEGGGTPEHLVPGRDLRARVSLVLPAHMEDGRLDLTLHHLHWVRIIDPAVARFDLEPLLTARSANGASAHEYTLELRAPRPRVLEGLYAVSLELHQGGPAGVTEPLDRKSRRYRLEIRGEGDPQEARLRDLPHSWLLDGEVLGRPAGAAVPSSRLDDRARGAEGHPVSPPGGAPQPVIS